jgi:3-oxoacyl-(acyl-carrier-protein) synthase
VSARQAAAVQRCAPHAPVGCSAERATQPPRRASRTRAFFSQVIKYVLVSGKKALGDAGLAWQGDDIKV